MVMAIATAMVAMVAVGSAISVAVGSRGGGAGIVGRVGTGTGQRSTMSYHSYEFMFMANC